MLRRTLLNQLKVMVGVKRVIDYTLKVRAKDNKILSDNVKMSMNPFDEIAVEEAVRLKEKKIVTEITAVTIGPKKSDEVLRTAMALGCDKALQILLPDNFGECSPLLVAKIFAKIHEEEHPDFWLLGKQAVDGDNGFTASLLAGLLDLPQGTYAAHMEVTGKTVKVTREVDVGQQIIEIPMPCVLSADLRLNTPRFASLPNIMKARKKPIVVRPIEKLGVDTKSNVSTLTLTEPAARKGGVKVKTVEELYEKLHKVAKVL